LPYLKSLALVLRAVDYGDTSQIVTFYTRELGKVAAIAKGAKRPSSRFVGVLEPLVLVELVCVRRRDSTALHTVTEVDPRDAFRGARASLSRLYAATYAIELLREMTPDEEPQPGLFDAALSALRRIASAEEDPALAVLLFEVRALELTGHRPEVERCAGCGGGAAGGAGGAGHGGGAPPLRAFSPRAGGALCEACAAADRAARPVSPGALKAFAALLRAAEAERAPRLKLAPSLGRELRELLNRHIAATLERELRLARFLSSPAERAGDVGQTPQSGAGARSRIE